MGVRQISDDELTLALVGALIVAGVGPALLGGASAKVASFLVAHHVLIQGPGVIVPLPGGTGAGLDGPRLVVATGLLLLAVLVLASRALTRHRTQGTS